MTTEQALRWIEAVSIPLDQALREIEQEKLRRYEEKRAAARRATRLGVDATRWLSPERAGLDLKMKVFLDNRHGRNGYVVSKARDGIVVRKTRREISRVF